MKANRKWIWIFMLLALPVSGIIAGGFGAVNIPPGDIINIFLAKLGLVQQDTPIQSEVIFWNIRLPRILMGLFIGFSLAVCGTSIQALFRNPLADHSIIGISAGSAMFSAIVIVLFQSLMQVGNFFFSAFILPFASFLGAVVASILVFRMGQQKKQSHVATMLLAGIAMNAITASVTGLLTFVATDAQLRTLTFWTLGSLGGASWTTVYILIFTSLLAVLFLFPLHKTFNLLALGEKEAIYLGVPMEKIKRRVIFITSICVGAAVAFCGIIGFVGLVIPHIMRMAGGSDHRFLLPASGVGGALLICWADTFSRTVVAPAEIPIGIITSLVGAPVFLYLLLKSNQSFQ